MTTRQHAKHMRRALRSLPGDREGRTCQKLLAYRDDLLANQNAQQTRQRDQRRRRRADVDQAIYDANQHAGAEGEEICEHVWHPAATPYAGTGVSTSCNFATLMCAAASCAP